MTKIHRTAHERGCSPFWWLGLAAVTLLAGALRFIDLNRFGFRIDEGFTLTYSRQSWPNVLGLHGFYSPHPPLYFALAKFADLIVPETIANRSVSAVLGTLTVPILFLLCKRLGEPAIGLAAALMLTLSPLHIDYSRDGRMYATVVFLIALSWLALVSFAAGGNRAWLPVLTLSMTAAFYVDYSAAYAVAPLGIALLVLLVKRHPAARSLAVAAGVSVLLYLPWVPEVVSTVEKSKNATARSQYLAASWDNIRSVFPAMFGFARWSAGGVASFASPWFRWPDFRLLLILPIILATALAVVYLRRSPVILWLALIMTGTPAVAAIVLSLVSPGFSARTIMASLMGWTIIASAGFCLRPTSVPLRALGITSWAVLLGLQTLTLPAEYEIRGRQEWPIIAHDLNALVLPVQPVLVFSTAGILTDVLDMYGFPPDPNPEGLQLITLLSGEREPWTGAERFLPRGITFAQMDAGDLEAALTVDGELIDAFWLISRFDGERSMRYILSLGYEFVGSIQYSDTLLELYALPGAEIGSLIADRPSFDEANTGQGWKISKSGTEVSNQTIRGDLTQIVTLVKGQNGRALRFPGTECRDCVYRCRRTWATGRHAGHNYVL